MNLEKKSIIGKIQEKKQNIMQEKNVREQNILKMKKMKVFILIYKTMTYQEVKDYNMEVTNRPFVERDEIFTEEQIKYNILKENDYLFTPETQQILFELSLIKKEIDKIRFIESKKKELGEDYTLFINTIVRPQDKNSLVQNLKGKKEARSITRDINVSDDKILKTQVFLLLNKDMTYIETKQYNNNLKNRPFGKETNYSKEQIKLDLLFNYDYLFSPATQQILYELCDIKENDKKLCFLDSKQDILSQSDYNLFTNLIIRPKTKNLFIK